MTTDRELLELAAKAAGIEVEWFDDGLYSPSAFFTKAGSEWNPLNPASGDALRLATKLRFTCKFYDNAPPEIDLPRVCAVAIDHRTGIYWAVEPVRGNEDEAMCRAIVLAAAAVGRNVK